MLHQSAHRPLAVIGRSLASCLLLAATACKVHAQQAAAANEPAVGCLPSGDGYLRARLSGALRTELTWTNEETACTGAVRPAGSGIRMRFSRTLAGQDGTLVLVFGITGLEEGKAARNVPVNVTVIRDGRGEFYSTQGDDKCMLDEVRQYPLAGIPRRTRSYRVVARGFCTGPARAVRGAGAVLLSRFDYAGRVDFDTEDGPQDTAAAMADTP
jgi:hypothetical protein